MFMFIHLNDAYSSADFQKTIVRNNSAYKGYT